MWRTLAHGCLFPNCVSCAEEIIRKCNFFAAISFLFDLNNLQITNSTSASRITTYRYNLLKKVIMSDFFFCPNLFFKNVIGGEGITDYVHEVGFPFSYLYSYLYIFVSVFVIVVVFVFVSVPVSVYVFKNVKGEHLLHEVRFPFSYLQRSKDKLRLPCPPLDLPSFVNYTSHPTPFHFPIYPSFSITLLRIILHLFIKSLGSRIRLPCPPSDLPSFVNYTSYQPFSSTGFSHFSYSANF